MWWLLLVPVLIGALIAGGGSSRPPRAPRPGPADDDDDVLDTLARYGTDGDARRLIEQGYGDDLAGLGYRPDGD